MRQVSVFMGMLIVFIANVFISMIFYKKYNAIEKQRSEMDEDDFAIKYTDKRKAHLQAFWGFGFIALVILVFLITEIILL